MKRSISSQRPAVAASHDRKPVFRNVQALAVASAIAFMAAGGSAHAQAEPAGESAMIKLIRGLIDSGALKKDVGEALLAQAQTEHIAAQQALRQAAAPVAPAQARVEPGDVRVPYVSQAVRDKIRDEVKGQIMAQARSEGWAAPNETPEWTKRIRVEGDVRLRNESRFYSDGNDNLGMIDWAAINSGSAYDINPNSNTVLPPQINTRQDRKNQWKARARLGVIADITEQTAAGVRLATGNDDSPVSTTQTLGGGLEKKSVWLDQAWFSHKPTDWLKITGGRFGNPFYSTDILYSNDLNFDGLAAQFNKKLSNERVSLFGTLGIIPLEYSSDKFPGNRGDKMSSETKWLLGAQAGVNWKLDQNNAFRGALAYYEFKNVNGERSDTCYLYSGQDTACSTDWTRPAFMQRGNTLMLLRNVALNPLDPANTPDPQYLGLASKFRLLDLNARWDTKVMERYRLRLDANYIRNLEYDADDMFARADDHIVNNFDGSGGTDRAAFRSGGNAWMLQATFGNPAPSETGEWNVLANYKYIQPDALPDGYNDSSFHLGGTNARGYTLGTTYAFDKNTTLTGRWMSSKQVYGQPYAIDLLQIELNTRF